MRREDKAFTDLTQEIDIKIFQDSMRGSFSDFPDGPALPVVVSIQFGTYFLLFSLLI